MSWEVVQIGVEEQAEDLGVVLGGEGGGQLTQPPQELPVLYSQSPDLFEDSCLRSS